VGAIAQLFRSLAAVVPFPVLVAIVAVLVALAIPGMLRTAHTRQIRTGVREVARATSQDARESREAAAIELTRGEPHLLFILADEAIRLNQRRLAERAVETLSQKGALPDEVARLKRALAPDLVPPAAAIEAYVEIRALHREGLTEPARKRLVEARARFPDDPDLADLERTLM
jgi:hypothetical protein